MSDSQIYGSFVVIQAALSFWLEPRRGETYPTMDIKNEAWEFTSTDFYMSRRKLFEIIISIYYHCFIFASRRCLFEIIC
jgi:hypothetical protein